jgi:chemotaxis protein CheZ
MASHAKREEEDLEALFEQVAAERMAQVAPDAPANDAADAPEAPAADVYHRLGQLTRTLHEALRELGYDRKIAEAAGVLPDARDRLSYIAKLSGDAAEKVLGAVERGQSIRAEVGEKTRVLAARWDDLYGGKLSVDAFKALAGDTRQHLAMQDERGQALDAELHAIMMAQDFHDLTGQVIKRVADLANTLESSLVDLLLEATPVERRTMAEPFQHGPSVRSGKDVVANQAQVDELLDSLGF